MTVLSDDARRVLEQPRVAHLVTLNADGSPQVTTVWVGLDGDEIVSAHLAEHQKVRNIRNDPRVALCIEAEGEDQRLRQLPRRVRPGADYRGGVRPTCCSGWRRHTLGQR